jgi:predicted Zn-ribbon and HTH transcriptional regulator
MQRIYIIRTSFAKLNKNGFENVVKIIPTRCNNCGLFFANALLYMFRVAIPPIIRSKFAVYGHR